MRARRIRRSLVRIAKRVMALVLLVLGAVLAVLGTVGLTLAGDGLGLAVLVFGGVLVGFGLAVWPRRYRRTYGVPRYPPPVRETIGPLDMSPIPADVPWQSPVVDREDWRLKPPTEKQLKFAKRLGISVPEGATRGDVSDLIDRTLDARPRQRQRIEEAQERRAREAEIAQYGAELVAALDEWQRRAEEQPYLLMAFRRGKDIVVDVVRLYDADIEDGKRKSRLVLYVEEPIVERDRATGERWLFWEKEREIPMDRVVWWESLGCAFDDLTEDELQKRYRSAVERGIKTVERLMQRRET